MLYANPDDPDFPTRTKPRLVCAHDGVDLAQARTGRWVHLGELPKEADPEHDPEPIAKASYSLTTFNREMLRQAAADMIRHHGAIHPDSACEFTIRLRAALRS